jgi:hypothetical protein
MMVGSGVGGCWNEANLLSRVFEIKSAGSSFDEKKTRPRLTPMKLLR